MYFEVINRTENQDKNGDSYAVLKLRSSTTAEKLIGGQMRSITIPAREITVVAYLNRDNMNQARIDAGQDVINRPEFYAHLANLPVGEWVEGTMLSIEHEPTISVIGDQKVSISQTDVLVNATSEDLDFNARVAEACKWRGVRPVNPAFLPKNKVLGQVVKMPVGMNTGEE
jgi:hypothetical protein